MNNVKTIQGETQSVGIFAFIAAYYSRILEQSVTIGQAKALVNAQCAFFAFVMPIELGIAYRALSLFWFVIALLQCKSRMKG